MFISCKWSELRIKQVSFANGWWPPTLSYKVLFCAFGGKEASNRIVWYHRIWGRVGKLSLLLTSNRLIILLINYLHLDILLYPSSSISICRHIGKCFQMFIVLRKNKNIEYTYLFSMNKLNRFDESRYTSPKKYRFSANTSAEYSHNWFQFPQVNIAIQYRGQTWKGSIVCLRTHPSVDIPNTISRERNTS